jgi:PPM family protein phosphatase
LRTAILDGIEKANRDVLKLGVGAATTLAVAEIQGNRLRTYHVGDSQIMVIGHKGKIKLKTMSHSPVGYAIEAGLLEEQDAIMHEELHLVSNLIGYASMHIEIGTPMELSPRDTVIIASDGLFDNLRSEEIAATCRGGQLLSMSRELISACRARMIDAPDGEPSKPDDLTFIAFRRRASASDDLAANSAALSPEDLGHSE